MNRAQGFELVWIIAALWIAINFGTGGLIFGGAMLYVVYANRPAST